MRNVVRHPDPRVHPLLVNGDGWRRKRRVRERADGNGNEVVLTVDGVVDGRSAIGAEMERSAAALISHAKEDRGSAAHGRARSRKACLSSEDAPRSALTREAVADGHPNRGRLAVLEHAFRSVTAHIASRWIERDARSGRREAGNAIGVPRHDDPTDGVVSWRCGKLLTTTLQRTLFDSRIRPGPLFRRLGGPGDGAAGHRTSRARQRDDRRVRGRSGYHRPNRLDHETGHKNRPRARIGSRRDEGRSPASTAITGSAGSTDWITRSSDFRGVRAESSEGRSSSGTVPSI